MRHVDCASKYCVWASALNNTSSLNVPRECSPQQHVGLAGSKAHARVTSFLQYSYYGSKPGTQNRAIPDNCMKLKFPTSACHAEKPSSVSQQLLCGEHMCWENCGVSCAPLDQTIAMVAGTEPVALQRDNHHEKF